jgi:hypothetical protein
VERHNHCLCLQVIFLQQTLLDDQIAVLALGREPLANLDESPVQVCRLLMVEDMQGAEPRSGAVGGRGAALSGWLSVIGGQSGRLGRRQPLLVHFERR